jgi:hypothetical protein
MRTTARGELTVSAPLEQNVPALDITLSADELAALEPLADQVAGERH